MQKTAASPIDLARVTAAKMADFNEALVLLDTVLYESWRSVEGYVARVLEPHVTDWKAPIKSSMSRPLMRALTDPVDLLDFSEAFLRLSGAPISLMDAVTRILQNDIELAGDTKMASTELEQKWGRTLREATVAPGLDGYDALMAAQQVYKVGLAKAEEALQKSFYGWVVRANKALKPHKLMINPHHHETFISVYSHGSDGLRVEGQATFETAGPTGPLRSTAEIVQEVLGVSMMHGSNVWDFGG